VSYIIAWVIPYVMPGITASSLDQDYPAKFFHSHAIDEFVVVSSLAIPAPFGRRPVDLFPTCRTMILFGKVMENDLFEGSVPETAPKITAFKQELAVSLMNSSTYSKSLVL